MPSLFIDDAAMLEASSMVSSAGQTNHAAVDETMNSRSPALDPVSIERRARHPRRTVGLRGG